MEIFYQVGKTKKSNRQTVDDEEIDLEKLNFALRQNWDRLNRHGSHVDSNAGVHGITGNVLGGKTTGKHPTDWPVLKDCVDGEFLLWNNEASGWRLYIRKGTVLMYLDLTVQV